MKETRELLKQKYKSGEISIREFKNGLKDIEEKDREQREKQIKLLEQEGVIL